MFPFVVRFMSDFLGIFSVPFKSGLWAYRQALPRRQTPRAQSVHGIGFSDDLALLDSLDRDTDSLSSSLHVSEVSSDCDGDLEYMCS